MTRTRRSGCGHRLERPGPERRLCVRDQAASLTVDAPRSNPVHPVPSSAMSGAADLSELISFAIGDDQYGVDIMAVREIKGWTEITHLPNQPDYMRGVLNLRGSMVPIIDLRCRFGQG